MEKRKVIVRIIVCFLAVMSFICLLTSEAEAKRQKQGNALSQYLDRQIKTYDVKQLIEVAKCKYATKEQLVDVAKRCASYYYDESRKKAIELAQALLKNKRSTGKVTEQLANANFSEIRLMVAKSNKSNEKTLESLAKRCASYYYDESRKKAIELAQALLENKKSTGKVTEQLANANFSEIQLMVAKSNKSNEETLKSLAKRCASYYYEESRKKAIKLAQALVRNKKSTSKVVNELANSDFREVVSIGHQWIDKKAKRNEKIQYLDRQIKTYDVKQLIEVAECKYATKKQLVEVAKRCASYYYEESRKKAIELAQALVKNRKSTGEVINELANSSFPKVVSIGHKALEKKVKKAKNKR